MTNICISVTDDFPPRQKLSILQHNVQTWKNKVSAITNNYNSIKPDVLLLNETSIIDGDRLNYNKIFNYNIFTTNLQVKVKVLLGYIPN